jgi:hypothetical protein
MSTCGLRPVVGKAQNPTWKIPKVKRDGHVAQSTA